jgi:hypothetical protein
LALTAAAFFWSANALSQDALAAARENAAQSGLSFEQSIEEDLSALGLEVIAARDWRESRLYENPALSAVITNARYKTIYGHDARIEFLLILKGRQILVEAKYQDVRGSTDEKLAYVYLNAVENIPEREFALVIDGEGWRPEARRWIEDKARETEGFYVFDPDAFIEWARSQL